MNFWKNIAFGKLKPLFLVLILSSLFLEQGSAADVVKDHIQAIQQIGSFFVYALVFLFLLMVDFSGGLLGTTYLTGPEASEPLRDIWVVVRNIVNLGFVFFIMFLAFSNFFSGNSGSWTIKEKLPRLMIAVIAVNFSFLAIRVMIDLVDVGTHAILGVSDTYLEEKFYQGVETSGKVTNDDILTKYRDHNCTVPDGTPAEDIDDSCKTVKETFEQVFCGIGSGDISAAAEDNCLFVFKEGAEEAILDGDDTNIFAAFAVHLGALRNLPLASANSTTDAAVVTIFALILSAAMIGAFAMVMAAMIGRLIFLWLAMAFSPVLVAGWILGFGGGDKFKSMFVTHLLIPLKVAAAFSVGFILFSSMMTLSIAGSGSIDLGPALLNLASFPNGEEAGTAGSGAFLWRIATVIIFWRAAKWATDGTVADSVVKGLDKFTTDIGKLAGNYAVDQVEIPGAEISLASVKDLPARMNRAQIGKREEALSNYLNPGQKKALEDFTKALEDAPIFKKGDTSHEDEINSLTRKALDIRNLGDTSLREMYKKLNGTIKKDSGINNFETFKSQYESARVGGENEIKDFIRKVGGNPDGAVAATKVPVEPTATIAMTSLGAGATGPATGTINVDRTGTDLSLDIEVDDNSSPTKLTLKSTDIGTFNAITDQEKLKISNKLKAHYRLAGEVEIDWDNISVSGNDIEIEIKNP